MSRLLNKVSILPVFSAGIEVYLNLIIVRIIVPLSAIKVGQIPMPEERSLAAKAVVEISRRKTKA